MRRSWKYAALGMGFILFTVVDAGLVQHPGNSFGTSRQASSIKSILILPFHDVSESL